MTRTSLAVAVARDVAGHGVAELGAQRVVTLRLFRGHIHRLGWLPGAEAGMVVLAVYLAIYVRYADAFSPFAAVESAIGPIWPKALLMAGTYLLALTSLGLYQLRQRARFRAVLVRLFMALMLANVALALMFYVVPSAFVGRGVVFLTAGFALTGLALSRVAFLRLADEEFFKRRVLVWGAGRRAAYIGKRLRRRTDQRGFNMVAYVRAPGDRGEVPRARLLEADGDLVGLALRHRIEEIVVAMDDRRAGFPVNALLECRLRGIHVSDLVSFLERESGRVSVELMHPSWLIFANGFRCDFLRLAGKRLFDISVGLAALIALCPVALVTALAILLEDRGPVLYRQIRTGQNGRLFPLLKFRSMRIDAERNGQAVWTKPGDSRITRVGAVIRRLRIDEIPQLVNVLAGHMSLVGPRPERPAFVQQLTAAIPFYPERHFVKPGITGWAQVRYGYGASEQDAQEKLEYDLYYVKHHSLTFDLMVLLQTVEIVLFRIGSR